MVVAKIRNMEHSGTFRNIPEHPIIMIIMIEINFERLKDQHFQQFRELSEAIMYILQYVN